MGRVEEIDIPNISEQHQAQTVEAATLLPSGGGLKSFNTPPSSSQTSPHSRPVVSYRPVRPAPPFFWDRPPATFFCGAFRPETGKKCDLAKQNPQNPSACYTLAVLFPPEVWESVGLPTDSGFAAQPESIPIPALFSLSQRWNRTLQITVKSRVYLCIVKYIVGPKKTKLVQKSGLKPGIGIGCLAQPIPSPIPAKQPIPTDSDSTPLIMRARRYRWPRRIGSVIF